MTVWLISVLFNFNHNYKYNHIEVELSSHCRKSMCCFRNA